MDLQHILDPYVCAVHVILTLVNCIHTIRDKTIRYRQFVTLTIRDRTFRDTYDS